MTRHYYNEIEPYAVAWLRNLMAEGLIPSGDIDTRSIEDVRPSDLAGYVQCHFFAGIAGWPVALALAGWPVDRPVWTGSCPCQPFSSAGKGAGFEDERHLWPAFHHLIAQCRPPGVFGEQVASKDAEPWIDLVHADLEAVAYTFVCVPFPAASVGAPHVRDRNYWVADTGSARGQRLVASDHSRITGPWGWRGQEDLRAIAAAPFLQGDRWPQPIVRRMDDGLPGRVDDLHAYGNAIVPHAAAEFIVAYAEARGLSLDSVREAA